MTIDYWIALSKSIPIKNHPHVAPLPKPTDEMIAAFEEQGQFKLPRGYIDFIKVFGPGELAWEYKIKAPGYPERGESVDLGLFNANTRSRLMKAGIGRYLGQQADMDRIARMVFFCATGNGEVIGWDSLDVQDSENHEYGIYLLTREPALVKLAASFEDFVEDICLGTDNINIPGWDEEECGPRRLFDPACDVSPIAPT